MTGRERRAGWLVCALCWAGAAFGQETRTQALAPQFAKGGLHRLLFGANYRELWTTPVELPVLDLRSFAGGLLPTRRVGHGQTQALALKGADGVAYTFRPVVKDPVGLLPVELRETLAADFVRDQMSSQHPAAHVIVPDLLQALGALHNTPRLVVMPDDPALGEFRADFANVVGDIEEFVGQHGFGGAVESIDGEELWKRLDEGPAVRVDAEEYLKLRLLDHLVGDWDRHRGQWTFARFEGRRLWRPIPEDRDQAFVRFEGLAIAQLRGGLPLLMRFGPRYPHLEGLLFDSWDVDRRLLTGLEWPAWERLAAETSAALDDGLLARAVARMPQAFSERVGAGLTAALRRRRDELAAHARRYYRFLAAQVDVRASEQADRAEVERLAGGDTELRLWLRADPPGTEPYYRRRFRADETEEVRLWLLGGDDELRSLGGAGPIRVRVVGGSGRDRYDDRAGGRLRIADSQGPDEVQAAAGTRVDRRPYREPPAPPRGAWIPPRDWGRRSVFPITRLTGASDLGLLVELGLNSTGYGFRKQPFADTQRVRLGYATRHRAPRLDYRGEFKRENSGWGYGLHARLSGIEMLRFYGFGNRTPDRGDDDFYRVEQDQFVLAPSLEHGVGPRGRFFVGPLARYVITEHVERQFIGSVRPYGLGHFWQAGVHAGLELDTRDKVGVPKRGVWLNAGGSYYPQLLDVESHFGELHGELNTYLGTNLPLEPTLVLAAGGKRVFGRYPYFDAAFIGGKDSLRGLRNQRYAGDGSLYGSAELRLSLARAFLLVPGEIGIFGLADAGRVYVDGQTAASGWHRGFGGGLYFASPHRRSSFSLAVARSEGRTGYYLRSGIGF